MTNNRMRQSTLVIAIFCLTTGFQATFGAIENVWKDVFEQSKNKVVQIFSQGKHFDLMRPYIKKPLGESSGSGFLLSKDGDIYTNFHVIAGSSPIQVTFPFLERERFEVDFVGAFPDFDLAHIRLKPTELERLKVMLVQSKDKGACVPTELSYFSLGDSDTLKEQDKVLVLGYPLGLEKIDGVQGTMRSETRAGNALVFMIDVSITNGNSGGPVLNQAGEVVGITVSMLHGGEGLKHIIPINRLKLFIDELENGNILQDAFWGFLVVPTTAVTVQYLKSPLDGGVNIIAVDKGSLFYDIGIQPRDILYAINGIVLDRFGQVIMPGRTNKVSFVDLLAAIKNGTSVEFTLYRDGQQMIVSVEKKPTQRFGIDRCFYPFAKIPDYDVFGGMVFVELTFDHLIKLDNFIKGDSTAAKLLSPYRLAAEKLFEPRLMITATFPETEVGKANLFGGDCIVSKINGIPVQTIAQFRDAVLNAENPQYLVVETEGGSMVALDMRTVCMQEPYLAANNNYPISPLYKALLEKYATPVERDQAAALLQNLQVCAAA